MSILLACPPEVISRIFQSGDFEDVLHLSLACKRLYEIWLSDSGNIIWQVGLNTILSFHEALIAVSGIGAGESIYHILLFVAATADVLSRHIILGEIIKLQLTYNNPRSEVSKSSKKPTKKNHANSPPQSTSPQ